MQERVTRDGKISLKDFVRQFDELPQYGSVGFLRKAKEFFPEIKKFIIKDSLLFSNSIAKVEVIEARDKEKVKEILDKAYSILKNDAEVKIKLQDNMVKVRQEKKDLRAERRIKDLADAKQKKQDRITKADEKSLAKFEKSLTRNKPK
jgi:dsDNA-specific endonuclease/ATPase MutS2